MYFVHFCECLHRFVRRLLTDVLFSTVNIGREHDMVKLILVDDEQLFLNSLAKYIAAQMPDFEICGCFHSLAFEGYSGIISMENDGAICGAMTEGRKIAAAGFCAELNGKAGLFFCKQPEKAAWQGELHAAETCQINICGQIRTVEAGHYTWLLETELQLVRKPDHRYDDNSGFVRDTRRHEFGFNGYDFDDLGEILTYPK